MKCFLYLFVAVLIAGTAAQASNMGFKVTINLDDTGTLKQNWFSLPYNTSYTDADSVKADINATGTYCDRVYMWNPDTDTYTWYSSTRSGTNFTIDETKAYMVTALASYGWVVVGSHDPAGVVNFDYSGTLKQNWISVPYHTTAADADALKTEMVGDGVGVDRVYKWNADLDTYTWYSSTRSGTNFTIDPGMGVMVTITNTSGTVTWTPEHY
jgi:hypothetical protein